MPPLKPTMLCTAQGAMPPPKPPPPCSVGLLLQCTSPNSHALSSSGCDATPQKKNQKTHALHISWCNSPPNTAMPRTPQAAIPPPLAPRRPRGAARTSRRHHRGRAAPSPGAPPRGAGLCPLPCSPACASAAMCSPALPRLPCHVHSSFLACEACSLSDSVAGKDGASTHLVQCESLAPGLATVSIQRHTDFNRLIQFFLIYRCSRS